MIFVNVLCRGPDNSWIENKHDRAISFRDLHPNSIERMHE
jgi:hypothetical protein